MLIVTFLIIITVNKSLSLKQEVKLTSMAMAQKEQTEDVYDVILFFGQSNMSGSMSIGIDTRYQLNNNATVESYSAKTGIDEDIINQSWVSNYTVTDVIQYMNITLQTIHYTIYQIWNTMDILQMEQISL